MRADRVTAWEERKVSWVEDDLVEMHQFLRVHNAPDAPIYDVAVSVVSEVVDDIVESRRPDSDRGRPKHERSDFDANVDSKRIALVSSRLVSRRGVLRATGLR